MGFAAPHALAKDQSIEWRDGPCKYSGIVDDSRHVAQEIAGALELLELNNHSLPPIKSANDPRQTASALRGDCDARIKKLEEMKFEALSTAESQRTYLIEDLRKSCDLEVATLLAESDPALLLKLSDVPRECATYRDALLNPNELKPVWRKVVHSACQKSASPTQCIDRKAIDAAGPDGQKKMWKTVLFYGWSNCMNRSLPHSVNGPDMFSVSMLTELKKHLGRFKEKCSEL